MKSCVGCGTQNIQITWMKESRLSFELYGTTKNAGIRMLNCEKQVINTEVKPKSQQVGPNSQNFSEFSTS